jgi:PST family polysaccharide transporter
MGLTQPLIHGVGLIAGLTLARFLYPRDYGVVAMVAGFTGLMSMVAGFGLSDASVRKKELSQGEASSLFWLNSALGVVFCMLAVGGGPLLASYFDEDLVPVIAAWAGISLFINSLSVQFRVQLVRSGRYGALSVADLGVQILAAITAIALAVSGFGWRALVALFVVQSVSRLIWYLVLSRWLPSYPDLSQIPWDTVRLGAVVCAGWIMTALTATAESAALGRLGGAHDLGLYNRAMQLARYPVMVFFVPAFLPAVHRLGERQQDRTQMGREHLRMLAWILVLASAPMGLLVGTGRDLVPAIMGDQWRPIVPLIVISGLGLMGLPMAQATNWGLTAANEKKRLLMYQMLTSAVMITAVVGGAFAGGPLAMCVAFTVGMWVVLVPVGVSVTGRHLGLKKTDAYRLAGDGLLLMLAVAGACYFVIESLERFGVDRFVRIAAVLPVGLAIWIALARFIRSQVFREVVLTLSTTLHLDRIRAVDHLIRWLAPEAEDHL